MLKATEFQIIVLVLSVRKEREYGEELRRMHSFDCAKLESLKARHVNWLNFIMSILKRVFLVVKIPTLGRRFD